MNEAKTCPKCKEEMEKGMARPDGGYVGMPQWGKEFNFFGKMKEGRDIKTFRCPKCGYLESYAP